MIYLTLFVFVMKKGETLWTLFNTKYIELSFAICTMAFA